MSNSVEVQGLEINYKRIIGEDYIVTDRFSKVRKPDRSVGSDTQLDVQ